MKRLTALSRLVSGWPTPAPRFPNHPDRPKDAPCIGRNGLLVLLLRQIEVRTRADEALTALVRQAITEAMRYDSK